MRTTSDVWALGSTLPETATASLACRLVNDSGHEVTTWSLKNISSVILSPSYASKGIWCQFKHGLHLLWWWVAWIAAGESGEG